MRVLWQIWVRSVCVFRSLQVLVSFHAMAAGCVRLAGVGLVVFGELLVFVVVSCRFGGCGVFLVYAAGFGVLDVIRWLLWLCCSSCLFVVKGSSGILFD